LIMADATSGSDDFFDIIINKSLSKWNNCQNK
jgi:hypothetical protein